MCSDNEDTKNNEIVSVLLTYKKLDWCELKSVG
jgi:hypothetical protein